MNQIIHCVIGFWNQIDIEAVKSEISSSIMLLHPRFSSLLVIDPQGREHWLRTQVNIHDHLIILRKPLTESLTTPPYWKKAPSMTTWPTFRCPRRSTMTSFYGKFKFLWLTVAVFSAYTRRLEMEYLLCPCCYPVAGELMTQFSYQPLIG